MLIIELIETVNEVPNVRFGTSNMGEALKKLIEQEVQINEMVGHGVTDDRIPSVHLEVRYVK